MFYEPQRYHFLTFDLFYKFITNKEYTPLPPPKSVLDINDVASPNNLGVKASIESAFALAQALNKDK